MRDLTRGAATTAVIAGLAAVLLFFAGDARAQNILEETAHQFSLHAEQSAYQLDHSPWSSFLGDVVFDMGMPTRRPAPRRKGGVQTGTRVSTGSRTRVRYEGNRVLFHLFKDDATTFLADYRNGLQNAIAGVDFASLSSDEQLAFWLNLHNVTLMHEIAKVYPVPKPSRIKIREQGNAKLFDAKLVTVNDVPLSLNDIRYGIVYRYWKDPDVIYGCWDGAIGGPDIMPAAYNGANVWSLLALGGKRYVNALRGVQSRSGRLRVSKVYDNSRLLFPNWPADLYDHLHKHANFEVKDLLSSSSGTVHFIPFDSAMADFSSGEVARFGGSDNPAAALSNKPVGQGSGESRTSGTPADILQVYGAPISSETNRGGVAPDPLRMKRRVDEELKSRARREGEVEIEDVETEDSGNAEQAESEDGEGVEENQD